MNVVRASCVEPAVDIIMEKGSILVHFGNRTKIVDISFEEGGAKLATIQEAVRQSFNIPTNAHLLLQVRFHFLIHSDFEYKIKCLTCS